MSASNYLDEMLPTKRSTMLTVLCILTFIGSGFSVINSGFSLSPAGNKKMNEMHAKFQQDKVKLEAQKEKQRKAGGSRFALKMMEASELMADPLKMRNVSIISLIAGLLTLSGAFLMWRRNRTGFFLYVAGCILLTSGTAYVYGNNFISSISMMLSGFISVVFIVLYALCLKEMRPAQKIS